MTANIPYRKKYNQNGELLNPIVESYVSHGPNRKERRENLQKDRFVGNGKNISLTVTGTRKYLRHRQVEIDKDGETKYILHYILL